jgi:hypothetical protein
VTFVWEPVPRPAGDQLRASEAPARVSLTAVAPDGSPYFRGRVPNGSSATPAPAGAALPASKVSFDVQPGKIQLRVSVESADAEVLDSEIREITVPDLTSPQAVIGTPAVYRARTVRELQQLKADAQATPTAGREFSRSDRVFLRVPVYGAGAAAPQLTARLLNRTGQTMSELPIADGAIDLTLTSLPPGEYIVEITASRAGGDAKELVGFRIVG